MAIRFARVLNLPSRRSIVARHVGRGEVDSLHRSRLLHPALLQNLQLRRQLYNRTARGPVQGLAKFWCWQNLTCTVSCEERVRSANGQGATRNFQNCDIEFSVFSVVIITARMDGCLVTSLLKAMLIFIEFLSISGRF